MKLGLVAGAVAMAAVSASGGSIAATSTSLGAQPQVSHHSSSVQVLRGTQLGINIKWNYRKESKAALTAQLHATLPYVKALGANSVAFVFDIYIDSATSNTVFVGPSTPPASYVAYAIATARQYGLNVLLRPLITETNPSNPWRGMIQPTNRTAWFNSYDQALKPYLMASQSAGATEFAYSCELGSLQGDSRWTTIVLPFMQRYFKHALAYDVSWDPPGLAPMPKRVYGIDAYPPVWVSDSATVAKLLAGWNAWLVRYPIGAPTSETYIMETGIAAQAKAYTHPSVPNWNTPIIPSVQAKWFQAACDFFRQHQFKGIYYFSTNLTEGPQTDPIGGEPSDFQGASLTVIKNCFAHP